VVGDEDSVNLNFMSKHRRKNSKSERDAGEEQAKGRKLMKLLNTDIKDLEIADSLRRIGNIQVMDWDFRGPKRDKEATLPSVSRKASKKRLSEAEMQTLAEQLKNFLRYVVENLIDEPSRSRLAVSEISPSVLQLNLVVVERDLAMLVGRGGQTAETIRSVLKGMGRGRGVDVLLKIVSHEEDGSSSK
jgi:predicted RNA-binding protein YlqC (UPF0109 family)